MLVANARKIAWNVDEARLPLAAPHLDKALHGLTRILLTKGAVGTFCTKLLLYAGLKMGACLSFRFLVTEREETVFDFTEGGGNLKKLFSDGGAVSVDGNPRKVLFTVKYEAVFQLF